MDTIYVGLTSAEASQSRHAHGVNTLPEKKTDSLFISFLKQFNNPLIYVLIVVAVITTVLGEYADTFVIMIVTVVNAVIGTVQNRKANNVLNSLKSLSRSRTKVIRNGIIEEIFIAEVVVGDYVVLSAGDIVPADGVLVEHNNLRINESKINGESMPMTKTDEHNQVFRSTVVISGSGVFVVDKVGIQTLIGQLSKDILENVNNETVLEQKIKKLVRTILEIVLGSVCTLVVIGLIREVPLFSLFKTAISLAVSAIPEGLPIVVTVVLAVGAWRISKVKGLLKNLPSGATLATVSYICTDKTGTLTKGDIVVKEIINLSEYSRDELVEYIAHSLDIKKVGKDSVGDILDLKVSEHIQSFAYWNSSKELPFMSENKFNAKEYVLEHETRIQVYKGAPELFVKDHQVFHGLVKQGFRVLAIGIKKVQEHEDFSVENVTPLALIVFEDPIRGDVVEAIADCKQAGLSILMITGDNIYTATHVAKHVGILTDDHTDLVIEGKELASFSDDELDAKLSHIKVIARANPLDKLRVVERLQAQGHVVAMTGDGVNDGPSIALADISIAMGKTGTEVAKEAADFILVEDSFSNIRDGIFEARTIIENIRKTLIFLLSTSLGEILIVVGSIAIGLPLPLLPVQILWINLITDGFLDVSIAQEKAEPSFKTYGYKKYRGALLKAEDYRRMFLMAATMAGVSLGTFYMMLKSYTLEISRTIMLCVVTVFQWYNALNVRKGMASMLTYNIFNNIYLTVALGFEMVLLTLSIYSPIGNKLLSTEVIKCEIFLGVFVVCLAIVVVDEVYKFTQRKA